MVRPAALLLPAGHGCRIRPRRVRPGARGAPAAWAFRHAARRADARARRPESVTDAIVVGPRAYETDSALVENNGRLLEYARRGGLVIVQYQQSDSSTEDFAPYPDDLWRCPHDRVTDETAPVRVVLAPGRSVVHAPNRIAESDWKGWVQERGLYFARSWDPALPADPRVARPRRAAARRRTRSSPGWARGRTCTPD